ncbi:MAG: AMP-binding protein, partial [Rubrivivax sp.]
MTPNATPRPHLAHWPARLPRELQVPQTSLCFNLEAAARRYPHKAAYLYLGREITWQELHRQAEALAGWLQTRGVQGGDRVLLFMQNCPQYVVAAFAVLRANAVIVPVNPMNRADEFGHYITDPEARVAIVSADLAAVVAEADARLPAEQRLQHVLVTRYADAMPAEAELDPAEAPAEPVLAWLRTQAVLPDARFEHWLDALAARHQPGPHTAGPDDLALLPYTSGTTGLPKGCMHTHRTLMHNVVG